MEFQLTTYIIFIILMFTGGFVDAVSGGGGIITIPAYLITGTPIQQAMGTNKFSSSITTISSFLQFLKSGVPKMDLLIRLLPFSLIGSAIGVTLFHQVKVEALEKIIPALLITIALYSFFTKNKATVSHYNRQNGYKIYKGGVSTFFIGMYDGFFGPGTGIFFNIMLVKVYGMDLREASGNTKLLNLVSGLTACIIFLYTGKVLFKIGMIGFISSLAGSLLGSHLAIVRGSKFIKPVFTIVSLLITIKLIIESTGLDFIP